MTPVNHLDYIFLFLTSALIGTYISLSIYQKKYITSKCDVTATTGGIAGIIGFSCTICNKIFLLILGTAGVLTYIEPIRPIIGSLGAGLMGYAVFSKSKEIANIK